ncbi:TolC family protein [Ferruginibacter albus]|uniref:TolC family protein n=1 Tax=Ferruginibacter albus TaxID=2875540 RepID=UPI001CC77D1B|nr:TolC family protein [Ferruginibacter albus]UAY52200.1 TolC family protein [Ferruginibacter albus]
MLYRVILLFFLAAGIFSTSYSQEKWDLRKCVDYALANNISIKQSDVQAKITALQYNQSKLSQYPTLGFSGNTSFNSGLHQDPTSFGLITQNYVGAQLQLQSSAQIFNWFSKQNTIAANHWQAEAAKAGTDKLKDDISLTVANAYLQVLLSKQQQNIAEIQLKQSKAQLDNTRKLVDAGSLPELNATELESQVETDSANYITAKGNVDLNILLLKANMNIDAAAPFEVDEPPVELIPVEKIADLQPDAVYALALTNLPQQRVNDFKLRSLQKSADVSKAAMYPIFSAFGSIGTGYSSRGTEITSSYLVNEIGSVTVGNTSYSVTPLAPITNYNYGKTAFFKQLNTNRGEAVGISLNVPIFNGGSYKTNWQIAKLNVQNQQLQKDADNQKLKQDIYQAYNAALVALQKFSSSQKAVDAAQRSYDFAQKRYDVGMLSTIELITNQNNLLSAKLQNVQNQFDYVFKMKVLEFYKGQGLKL